VDDALETGSEYFLYSPEMRYFGLMRGSKVHALRTERMSFKLQRAVLYMSSLVYQP